MSEENTIAQDPRLTALYRLSSQLGETLDLYEVLNQVMDAIIQLTGAERGFLMLYDEAGKLVTRAARNVDQKTIDTSKISRTVVDRVLASGEGVLTSNAQEDVRFSSTDSVVGFQLRSIMCAPLRARGTLLGAVYVDNRGFSGVFKQQDLDLLVTFANQAAIAIENARLFQQTDKALARRVEELSLFQRIDQQLNKSLDLTRVLNLSLNWAIALTNANGGSIGLLEEPVDDESEQEQRYLRLMVYRGNDQPTADRLVSLEHPVLAQVMAHGRSVLTRRVTPENSIDGTPANVQLAVPIKQEGIITGLITLETQHAMEIGQEDIAFVERLADRATVAINNARLYEAIQNANQAKSEFISVVTHELRLPMTSIKGYTDLMISGMAGELSEMQEQFLATIRRNLNRMNSLISDLSDINRIETGRMKFELESFNLADVVADVADNMRQRFDARRQQLTINLAADLPPVFADPNRISQVLTNLVSNANKYTPDGGQIEIRAIAADTDVQVSIIDNGIGITPENQEKLFTQFFRAEDEEVRAQPGWGLGLSIVRKMVEAQNGEIGFASEFGRGSTFTFTVPLANIKEETTSDQPVEENNE